MIGGLDIEEFFGQIVGAIALSFLITTYFKKNKAAITRAMLVSDIFYIIHYFLIGALSGSYALAIAVFRDSYIYLREKHHKKYRHRVLYNNLFVFIILLTVYAFFILINIEKPLNILPFVAGMLYLISEWFGNKFIVKLASGTLALPWLVYDILNFSIPGITTDLISMFACIAGLSKDKQRRNPRKKHHKKL